MKKYFNEEMYKQIKKEGSYKNEYYDFILINKNEVYSTFRTNWLEGRKYEFYGILDNNKKDIFTLSNAEEIQNELLEETKEEIIKEIKEKEINYLEIQEKNFNILTSNEDFKKSILYTYRNDYSGSFTELFVKGITPEDFKNELYKKIIYIKGNNNECFLKQYIIEEKENIKEQIKKNVYNGDFLNKWDFDYNWNNENKINIKIDFSFNNEISLRINKIKLIVAEYEKIYNNPTPQLKKSKEIYNLLKDHREDYKSCNITLKGDFTLKVIDFSYFVYILESGKEKAYTYRLLTGPQQYQLEKYNEEKGRGTRENDLFVEDITKIEYSKKTLYEGKEV